MGKKQPTCPSCKPRRCHQGGEELPDTSPACSLARSSGLCLLPTLGQLVPLSVCFLARLSWLTGLRFRSDLKSFIHFEFLPAHAPVLSVMLWATLPRSHGGAPRAPEKPAGCRAAETLARSRLPGAPALRGELQGVAWRGSVHTCWWPRGPRPQSPPVGEVVLPPARVQRK